MMFARNLKPGESVKIAAAGGEVLHLSQACLLRPSDSGRNYLKVIQGKESFAACVLQKDKLECCSLDLFLSAKEGLLLQLEGKSELSLLGYFEPEAAAEEEADFAAAAAAAAFDSEEDSEEASEDETEGMSAPVVRDGRVEDLDAEEEDTKKKGKVSSKKGAAALKALQAAAADDDDDEDDEEDDEDDEDDDEEGSEEESGEEEEEDSEEEEEAPKQQQQQQDKKRKQQQQKQQQQQPNKKAKNQAGEAAASSSGDEAAYRNALVDFLKKNGPTPLASLGQKVKKPSSLPKMAAFLKANADKFAVEGGKCSLK